MKKTKTRILTVLLALALTLTVFSVGSVTAFADVPDDTNINGTPIADLIESEPGFAFQSMVKLWFDDLPEERMYGTLIFVDSQLIAYNIVQELCEAFFDDVASVEAGLQRLYENGIWIFVHTGNWTFTNITMQAMGYADYAYDFTEQETYEWLDSLIGQVAMCGMTILNMDYSLYSFLLFLQNAWSDRMPVYAIQRDPITYGENGLKVDIFNSNGFTSSLGGDLSEIVPGD